MHPRGPHLARLAKALRRHARNGWQRAVFSRPGAADHERPELLEHTDDVDLDHLVAASAQAAQAGRVKQVLVLDATTRVRFDARYGKAKVHTLDAAAKAKVMGGKARALEPDRSADLLRVIGIMNPDGTISTKAAKKYKQVNHFVELCRPAWERRAQQRRICADAPLRVLDVACGNGYLTFVLAEALRLAEQPAQIHGVDLREDVVSNCRQRATALGWSHLTFEVAPILAVHPEPAPDILMALHACDTASDDALALGIQCRIPVLLVAPCCQREVAAQLKNASSRQDALTKHGLLRREYASTLTDALRVELLEAHGYNVDVVEFVDSAHSAKNLLLRALLRPELRGRRFNPALAAIKARCEALEINPALLRRLQPGPQVG